MGMGSIRIQGRIGLLLGKGGKDNLVSFRLLWSHSGLTHDRFSLGLSPFLREKVVERLQKEAAKVG